MGVAERITAASSHALTRPQSSSLVPIEKGKHLATSRLQPIGSAKPGRFYSVCFPRRYTPHYVLLRSRREQTPQATGPNNIGLVTTSTSEIQDAESHQTTRALALKSRAIADLTRLRSQLESEKAELQRAVDAMQRASALRQEAEDGLTERLRSTGGTLTADSEPFQQQLAQALSLEHAAALQLQKTENEVTRIMDKVEEREHALSAAQEALLQIRGELGKVPVSERLDAINRLKEENAALRDVLDTLEDSPEEASPAPEENNEEDTHIDSKVEDLDASIMAKNSSRLSGRPLRALQRIPRRRHRRRRTQRTQIAWIHTTQCLSPTQTRCEQSCKRT